MESRIDSGARVAIVGTYRSKATWWKVIYPCDILTVIIIRNVWFFRCAREASLFHSRPPCSTKKGEEEGKGGEKKWNDLSTRFDFWSADDTGSRRISDLPPRFLAQSAPSTFVSYTCATQPREGVSLKAYSRYITREERKNEKDGYFHDTRSRYTIKLCTN